MSDNLPDASASGETPAVHDQTDSMRKLTRWLHRLAGGEIEKYEQSKVLPFPFYVTETLLRDLQAEVLRTLKDVPVDGIRLACRVGGLRRVNGGDKADGVCRAVSAKQ